MRRLALVSAALLPVFAVATDVGIPGFKVSKPPLIDGALTVGEWNDMPNATGFVDKETGKAAEPGEFWVGYDDRFIYFAARVKTDPAAVRATEYRENVSLKSDDFMYLALDPFGSGSALNIFGVNAKGATDVRIAGGRAPKREWLGEILASGRKVEDGYIVEARIPWSIMRLPAPGARDLRLLVGRYNAAIQRESHWVYLQNGKSDIPYWRNVQVPAGGAQRSIKLLPYAYGGWNKREHVANAGLDLKTSLTDRIDAVATINPDFRNVENQILSLDFSYFERLAGESRPFFLEGGEYFRTSMDSPLFASQRIQKFDAGFKSFGQITDRTNFAMLDTIDFGERNNFVMNIRHQAADNTGISGAITSMSDRLGSDNVATYLAFDTSKNGLGFFGHHMMTKDTALGSGHRINTGLWYNRDGWNGYAEYVQVSENFLPRLGFAPERDFKGVGTELEYSRPVARGPIMEWEGKVSFRDLQTNGGAQYRRDGEASASLTFRDGTDLDFGGFFSKFKGSNDHLWFVSLERPRGDNYRRWEVDAQTGRISGQRYDSYGLSIAYRPLERLQLSLRGQEVRHFDKSTQVILGANYDIGKDMSISGRAVRRGNDLNAYLAFRKSGSRGAEYYVIFGDPNSRTFQRALVVKAVFPLEIKY